MTELSFPTTKIEVFMPSQLVQCWQWSALKHWSKTAESPKQLWIVWHCIHWECHGPTWRIYLMSRIFDINGGGYVAFVCMYFPILIYLCSNHYSPINVAASFLSRRSCCWTSWTGGLVPNTSSIHGTENANQYLLQTQWCRTWLSRTVIQNGFRNLTFVWTM